MSSAKLTYGPVRVGGELFTDLEQVAQRHGVGRLGSGDVRIGPVTHRSPTGVPARWDVGRVLGSALTGI